MISINPVPANVHFSVRDNLDPDSNVTKESDSHSEILSEAMISIREGIHRVLTEKCPEPTTETSRIFETTSEVCDSSLQSTFMAIPTCGTTPIPLEVLWEWLTGNYLSERNLRS
jgi:hypothetical protein